MDHNHCMQQEFQMHPPPLRCCLSRRPILRLALALVILLLLSFTGAVSAAACTCIPCGSTTNRADFKRFAVCGPAVMGRCDARHGSETSGCYSSCTCNCQKHPDDASPAGTCGEGDGTQSSDFISTSTRSGLPLILTGLCVSCCFFAPQLLLNRWLALIGSAAANVGRESPTIRSRWRHSSTPLRS